MKMIRFLKVNDIGVVSIDKIEAFNAVVRVGKLKSGSVRVIAEINVVMESGDLYDVLELSRERLIHKEAGEEWGKDLAPIPFVKSELYNTITHIVEDIAHGSAPVVEVRRLDLVAISEAVVKAVKPTKAERYLEEDESQGVESVLLDAE
jgi:hypothetical protein